MAEAAAVMAAVGTAVALIVDVVASVVATTGLWRRLLSFSPRWCCGCPREVAMLLGLRITTHPM